LKKLLAKLLAANLPHVEIYRILCLWLSLLEGPCVSIRLWQGIPPRPAVISEKGIGFSMGAGLTRQEDKGVGKLTAEEPRQLALANL